MESPFQRYIRSYPTPESDRVRTGNIDPAMLPSNSLFADPAHRNRTVMDIL